MVSSHHCCWCYWSRTSVSKNRAAMNVCSMRKHKANCAWRSGIVLISEDSLTCHIFCDTWHFVFLHLWWSLTFTLMRLMSAANRTWTPELLHARRTLRENQFRHRGFYFPKTKIFEIVWFMYLYMASSFGFLLFLVLVLLLKMISEHVTGCFHIGHVLIGIINVFAVVFIFTWLR